MTMKKALISFLGYLVVPALFAGHYFTQHFGFLFVFGALLTITVLFLGFAVFVLFWEARDPRPEFKNAIASSKMQFSPLKKAYSILFYVLTTSYLIYFEFYFLAAMNMVSALLLATINWFFTRDEQQA